MIDDYLLKSIINEIDYGISAVDIKGDFIIYNRYMGILEGIHPQEILGKNLFDFYPDITVKTS